MTTAIDGWGLERDDYDFEAGDFDEETGHFTQLVWKNTTGVGCGVEDCEEGGWLLFCEYWPRGNIIGTFTDQVEGQVSDENNDTGAATASGGGEREDDESMAGKVGVAKGYVFRDSSLSLLMTSADYGLQVLCCRSWKPHGQPMVAVTTASSSAVYKILPTGRSNYKSHYKRLHVPESANHTYPVAK